MLSTDEGAGHILPNRETREVRATDVGHLLRELGLQQEAFIVIWDDQILTRDVQFPREAHLSRRRVRWFPRGNG
jgi:sulfur carrier protein ThiS